MGSLVFVGAGLDGISQLSPEALNALKHADAVFLEEYTTLVEPSLVTAVTDAAGCDVRVVKRAEVEKGDTLLDAASRGMAVLMAGGDSMSATTHSALRVEAAKRGIETSIIFAPSIFTAAPSLLGLHHYKFGRTVTIPRFAPGYRPESPFRTMLSNLGAGSHTLALLDIDAEKGYFMDPAEAFGEIVGMGISLSAPGLSGDTFACVVSRAGRAGSSTAAGSISRLSARSFGPPPHCLVIPGRLHFQEAEALFLFSGATREELSRITD